ncbi:hypothetical protein [Streptomyces collinus]|uniref:hypothetical protein n=1 Tax=Streptomyces collinus TaxID=42684 RepID=UPI00362649F9
MGRVGRRFARVQVSSRLTWTFSARATLGRARPARSRLSGPVTAAGLRASAVLLRSALRAARPRPHPALPRAPHPRRVRPR